MATSNLYQFGSSNFDTLLKTVFQLCGILPSEVDGWKAQLALQSANLILSDWANRGNNLWLSQTLMMPIIPGQQTYLLPKQVTYVKELQAVQLQQITGTRIDSATNPSYTGVMFSAPSSISYASFLMEGYPTAIDLKLDLRYGIGSAQVMDRVTRSAYSAPWTPSTAEYIEGVPVFFVPTAPITAAFYVFEEADNKTIYGSAAFYTQKTSRLLVSLSENDYFSIPQPNQQPSSISSYYLDRQIQPTINLWPVPDNTYDAFVMKCMTTAQDAGSLVNQGQVPQRFIRALVYEMAAELSLQFVPDRYQILRMEADKLFDRAANEDRERVPLRITPNFLSYT